MSADLHIAIGAYDATTRTVPVTFTKGEIVHIRSVNACHDEAGGYDAAATAIRVQEVARGVEHKIALGVITSTPPADEETEEPTEAET